MTEPTYVQEYNAIAEVLNKYLEGNAKGNSAATKLAFHEKATFFGVNGNEVVGPEIQKLYSNSTAIVENTGHLFGEDLSDQDKNSLTAFLATL